MNRKSKEKLKDLGIAAGITATAAATSYLLTNFLVRLAMNRDMQKVAENAGNIIAGNKIDEGFFNVLKTKSDELAKKPNEEIKITAHDGIKLVGHYIPSEKPERVLIAMHGWRSSWHSDFGMVSDAWEKYNCSVLYAEQRGQNNSGGEYMGFGLTERYDCVSWVNWVIENVGEDIPIYLVGVSMGATTVLLASELNLPKQVHGIIADCGFTSPDAIWKHIARNNLKLLYGLKGIIADDLYERNTTENSEYSTENALRNTDIPVLFVHGTNDHFVPVRMTYDNYAACASPKEMLIVPGADHGMSYYLDQNKYENMVLRFWNKYDKYER